ncbi:DUF6236 family protein [Nocardia takedensis]
MPEMLYYPRIKPPKSVIYQALLYWDAVSSFVPPAPGEGNGPDLGLLDPDMHYLREIGIYRPRVAGGLPIGPHRLVRQALNRFDHLVAGLPAGELDPLAAPDSFLYVTKLNYQVVEHLERLGLGARDPHDRRRLRVSAAVQLGLISVLARDYAAMRSNVAVRSSNGPVYAFTDSPAAHLLGTAPLAAGARLRGGNSAGTDSDVRDRGTAALEIEIGRLLPIPRGDVDIRTLVEFRERHDVERRRLMSELDGLVHQLRNNYDHPEDVLRAVGDKVAVAREDLEAAGRAVGIAWVYRSVSVSVALGAGFVAEKVSPGSGWVLGVLGGVAVNIATNQIHPVETRASIDISYLLRVEKALKDSGVPQPDPA